MSELVIWSGTTGTWVTCPASEITWLDRSLLSGGRDPSLHRSPRCPALRHVHYRWELFSRDTSHPVYVAPFVAGAMPDYRAVRAGAQFVLPLARGALETQPVRLERGAWAISVGKWVLPVCVSGPADIRDRPTVPSGADALATYELERGTGLPAVRKAPAPDAAPAVARYFQRNPGACLAMAYYYQDFIGGGVAPQPRPMDAVAIALDLTRSAVPEYKKELQRRIWGEQGHQRELGAFLLENGLIGPADLQRALAAAAANEAAGRTRLARERLRYNKK
jgi:hypothetical protein